MNTIDQRLQELRDTEAKLWGELKAIRESAAFKAQMEREAEALKKWSAVNTRMLALEQMAPSMMAEIEEGK